MEATAWRCAALQFSKAQAFGEADTSLNIASPIYALSALRVSLIVLPSPRQEAIAGFNCSAAPASCESLSARLSQQLTKCVRSLLEELDSQPLGRTRLLETTQPSRNIGQARVHPAKESVRR